MRLQSARIRNFRAINDLLIDLDQQTTLIGANGVGKSCILKALDKFFSSNSRVELEDFHEGNTADPIDIALTFVDFSPEEQEVFQNKIFNGQMVVVRRFFGNANPRDNGKFFGQSYRHPKMQELRSIEGGTARRQACNQLVGTEGFEDLQHSANAIELTENMAAFELAHLEQCSLELDDGQFFGFTNVGRGILNKYMSFVFVPAVRDARVDAVDGKNTVISQLVELVVKSVVQRRDDIKEFQVRASAEYSALVSPENLEELSQLSDELTGTLQVFYEDAGVDLAWQPPGELVVSLPLADVSLTEKWYSGPVENKGHGLQRALIFTLLQHLAKVLSLEAEGGGDAENAGVEEGNNSAGIDSIVTEANVAEASHRVILAIEEPELYQHPIKQRHLARVLRQIAEGAIPGVMSQTQVISCSHSPHFITASQFPSIRVARRHSFDAGTAPQCHVQQISYAEVVQRLTDAYDGGEYDEAGLVARLHILDEAVNEGFFSQKAVLVEGAGDKAAILAVAKRLGVDFEAKGVSVIPVGGKANLDRPLAIFQLLGIPTYVIFDSDSDLPYADQKVQQNIALQRLSGVADPVEHRTAVDINFASFERNLTVTLREELGEEFEDQASLVAVEFGMKKKNALKNPVTCGVIIDRCHALGGHCGTLEDIVKKIIE